MREAAAAIVAVLVLGGLAGLGVPREASAEPILRVEPASGTCDSPLSVLGLGFDPGATVIVFEVFSVHESAEMARAIVDVEGRFRTDVSPRPLRDCPSHREFRAVPQPAPKEFGPVLATVVFTATADPAPATSGQAGLVRQGQRATASQTIALALAALAVVLLGRYASRDGGRR